MKKLLLTTAFCALALPAYAKTCGSANGTATGGTAAQRTADVALFTIYDGSCSSDPQANDGDDLKGFLDKGGKSIIPGPNIDLSLFKNTQLAVDQNIMFKDLSAGDAAGFTDGNGFANIKSTGDALQQWEIDPIDGSIFDKLGTVFNGFDGLLFRGQFADFAGDPPNDTASFTFDIKLSDGVTISETFNNLKLNADDGVFGFDEVGALPAGLFVDSVGGLTDPLHSWDQIKQLEVSVPGAVASIPEPRTWVMMATGFGLLGFAGFTRRRSSGLTA